MRRRRQYLNDSSTHQPGGLAECFQKLRSIGYSLAQVVELRYFGGLDIEQTAESLGISPATVKRDWTFARAFLQREMDGA